MQLNEGLIIAFSAGSVLAFLLSITVIKKSLIKQSDKQLRYRKDQFISLASHYLLNPITIIQTAVTSLQEEDARLTAEGRQKLYNAIASGQQRLWILSEQLMMVGEIDQGDMQLHIAVADVYKTISDAVASVDAVARSKQVKVHLQDLTKDVLETRFDARRMRQAIIAVLDNAIKFSSEGMEILVTLSLDSNIFEVTIEDQGIGMTEEMARHITDTFYRGNKIYTFDYEGVGLGLHVAKAIVQMHQGRISFESKPKHGTRVTIQFPNL